VTSAVPQLRHYRALGLAGSLILAASAGLGAGAMPRTGDFWPGLAVLRHAPGLPMAGAYLGLVLLVGAWLGLGRRLADATPRQLVGTFLAWAAPLALTPPMWSRDPYCYLAQGEIVLRGLDPYRVGPAVLGGQLAADCPPIWLHSPAPYGPLFLVPAAGVMRLAGGNTVLAMLGVRALALVGAALILAYLPRLARLTGHDPAGALWLGALNPLVLASVVAGAHNEALMVGLMLAGVYAALRGRGVLAAVVITLAALVKAPAVVALLFVVPVIADQLPAWVRAPGRRISALAAAAGLVGAVAAATAVLTTLACRIGYGWVDAVRHPVSVRNGLSVSTDLGILIGRPGQALGLLTEAGTVSVFRAVGQLAFLAVCGWALWRVRRLGPVAALGIALSAIVLLAPVVHPWYLLWGFPLLAAAFAAQEWPSRFVVGVPAFVVGVSVLMTLVVLPNGDGPTTATTIGALTGSALGLAVLALARALRHTEPADRAVPTG